MRLTVRLKITVLFAVLFAVLAAVLVATAYSFMAAKTTPAAEAEARAQAFRDALQEAGVSVPDLPQQPGPGQKQGQGGPDLFVVGGPNDEIAVAIHDVQEQARQNVLHDLLRISILAAVVVAVIAIPVSWWLAGRVLAPIDEVVGEANALSASSLSRRLPADGPDDEFRRLKTAFNGMLDRLESAFEARQRFAADASHELRTPLAVLGAMADNTLEQRRVPPGTRAFASEVRTQVDRSESLVNSLLTLARADDVGYGRERVDLADVVASAVSAVADDAARAGIEVDLDLSDAPVDGDPVLLGRMVANALDNAVKYNLDAGGRIACATGVSEGHAAVKVANTGTRIPRSSIPRLFERFERGESRSERDGHGLGLPIIRRVAEAHGGSVDAAPRKGGGLEIAIRIPVASDGGNLAG